MFTMILLLYLQHNLDVVLEGSSLRGEFASRTACEKAATRLRGPLPTPEGHTAAWQDVLCVPIAHYVQVRPDGPSDLARLLKESTPTDCGADGAWRRVAETCKPTVAVAPGDQSRLNSAWLGHVTSPAKPSPPPLSKSSALPPSAPNMLGRTLPPERQ